MFASFMRKSAIALLAVSALGASAPAFAGGYNDPQVILAENYGDNGRVIRQPDYQRRDFQQEEELQRQDFGLMSPREIMRQLRHQGYGKVREITQRGSEYRVVAVRHNGALVKLVVDGETGEILSERRVGWVRNSQIREPVYPVQPHRRPGFSIQFGFGDIR